MKLTPMMQQFNEIKVKYTDCILFYRLGDFYEMFFDDALLASKELEITLTGRDCGMEERAPMCGVPFHSADSYIARLVEKGYKVAICEQVEDAKEAKGLVKRDVVRVITKGTVTDNKSLDERKNNFIMCIYEGKKGYGVSVADVTTGGFFTTSFHKDEDKSVIDEIAKYNPSEIIVNEEFINKDVIRNIFDIKPHTHSSFSFEYANALKLLCEHFKVKNLSGFGISQDELAVGSAGALLNYLYETQMNDLSHISSIKNYALNEFMFLDISSRRNLELCETIRERSKKGSLLSVLDKTKTSMGARQLRRWLEQPLLNISEINKRLDAVAEYKNDTLLREEIKELLGGVYDIERLTGRIVYNQANCRDFISLKKSIEHFPRIKNMLSSLEAGLNKDLYLDLDTLEDIFTLLDTTIAEEPPISLREGGFIKDGFNEELDRYRFVKNKAKDLLDELEEREKTATGIKNLKIKYNKVFGFHLEVTNSYSHMVPERYIRRQTLANAERYITTELKELEDEILLADEKINKIEYDLFTEIRNTLAQEISRIQKSAGAVSILDVLQSLGDVADSNRYSKPIMNNEGGINIKGGRHPVVERLSKEQFIENDTFLDLNDNRLAIITGPNMAGKSTYMRQVALIVLMAQIGSFVPANSAEIGACDRIFTRVGASDDLATGQSTFMVEMSEVANILNNATKNSLLILDEIGRGTSTYDGLSIAWAVLEHIADKNKLGAKTLFATHYHELTELEGRVEGVVNYRITVLDNGKDIVFLRKIERGGADRSYGIHVAKAAGIPVDVIKRSNQIMSSLVHSDILRREASENGAGKGKDGNSNVVHYGAKKQPTTTGKYDLLVEEFGQELTAMDLNNLTPRDAITKLYDLKEKFDEVVAKSSEK